jgi:hypothetical protein
VRGAAGPSNATRRTSWQDRELISAVISVAVV